MTAPTKERSERELQELLPFYVNGSLDGEDLAAVETYLASSDVARAEVAYLKRLRQAVRTQPRVNSPGELGLKRLQREMARSAAAADDRGQRAGDLAKAAKASAGVTPWWRNLAVAACLALAVLAGLTIADWPGGDLRLAGGDSGAALQVTFKPQVTEEAIRTLLLDIGATIVDGPSALGIYRLSLAPNAGDAALEDALVRLRARGEVVESAERE